MARQLRLRRGGGALGGLRARRARRRRRAGRPREAAGARADRLPRHVGARRAAAGLTADAAVLGYWQDREPLEALETATLADALGYGELWVGEMATFDAFALAAAIAARTSERLELCVGPLAVGVRDPMAMAMGVASVAALGGGRPVHLAIGASSPVVVAAWHGREWARTAAHLRETAQAVRPLLSGERAAFDGELARTHGYRLRLPAPRTSLTVAAFGARAVRVAAECGDRMVVNLVTPEVVAGLRARYGDGRLAAWVVGAVEPAPEAFAQMRRGLVAYLGVPGYAEMFEAAGFGELVAFARSGAPPREVLRRVPDELCAAVGLVGSRDEVAGREQAYRAAGVDELCVVPVTAGDPGGERTLRALSPAR